MSECECEKHHLVLSPTMRHLVLSPTMRHLVLWETDERERMISPPGLPGNRRRSASSLHSPTTPPQSPTRPAPAQASLDDPQLDAHAHVVMLDAPRLNQRESVTGGSEVEEQGSLHSDDNRNPPLEQAVQESLVQPLEQQDIPVRFIENTSCPANPSSASVSQRPLSECTIKHEGHVMGC